MSDSVSAEITPAKRKEGYRTVDFQCCEHCHHDEDPPPHPNPCAVVDCLDGKKVANIYEHD